MRVLRASIIALFTAFFGCLLAFFVGDYLSRLAQMSNMEGGRGMFVVFVCAPLGILVGLVIGIVSSIWVRAPATFTIPDQPDGHSIRVSLYADNRQDEYAFIDWSGIIKDPEHATIPGHVPLLTHSKTRSLLASIGNEPVASQFIELRIPPKPRKDDEAWSDWIFATQRADLSPVSESEQMAIRYRVRPVND